MALSKIPSDLLEGAVSFNSAAPADSLVIDANGNVGVGTSSPSANLHVKATGAAANLYVASDISTSALASRIGLGNSIGPVRLTIGLLGSAGETAYLGTEGNFPIYFQTNGTERLRIDSAGRVTMPYQPAWCYNTRNNWTNDQWAVITFSSYWNISGNRYQGSYTTGTFTAPVAGIYQINFTDVPYSGGSSSAYVQYNLYKNGASWVWLTHSEYASVRNYEPVSASCVIELAAGDTIAIGAYPSGMNNNNANACTFSGYLIG